MALYKTKAALPSETAAVHLQFAQDGLTVSGLVCTGLALLDAMGVTQNSKHGSSPLADYVCLMLHSTPKPQSQPALYFERQRELNARGMELHTDISHMIYGKCIGSYAAIDPSLQDRWHITSHPGPQPVTRASA